MAERPLKLVPFGLMGLMGLARELHIPSHEVHPPPLPSPPRAKMPPQPSDPPAEKPPARSLAFRLRRAWARCRMFWSVTIWRAESIESGDRSGHWMRRTRIVFITWDGLANNQLFARAAALSYSSLLALGPMVAMLVLFSGALLKSDAETQIKNLLYFVAPSLQEYLSLEVPDEAGDELPADYSNALDDLIDQIVQGAESIVGQINTGGSQAFGFLGFIILAFIAIQMLTAVEKTLNQIWGARSGRSWGHRVVSYWTFISLGTVFGLGATAIFSASAAASLFEVVPFGETLNELFVAVSPFLGFGMLVLLLTAFYRYFPNAPVKWKPALIGASVVAALLFLNNYLSVLYVGQVLRLQSLYGSVGIIPVFMLGLYFFWIFVLLGGQLSYAIQNVNYLSRREAWSKVSPGAQETLTLAAFLLVARDFVAQRPPLSASELSARMRVPGNVLNEALDLLVDFGWIAPTWHAREEGVDERCYQPAKPLGSVTLADFRTAFADFGNSPGTETLDPLDPVLAIYRQGLDEALSERFGGSSVEALLAETSVDRSDGGA